MRRRDALQGGSVPVSRLNQMSQIDKEIHVRLLRYLTVNPQVSQRELAQHLGVSLGKTNYCLRALVDKGLVKARNFKNSASKRAYLYLLTPKGLRAKAEISVHFLQRKIAEHETLRAEIEELRNELQNDSIGTGK
jgi:EPS-associated MarR family transcriptional regulator